MEGIGELRVKESDRIAAVLAGLKANGVDRRGYAGLAPRPRHGEVPAAARSRPTSTIASP
jgi:3-phosphoshikimate 1-carboxyvinyltransferase